MRVRLLIHGGQIALLQLPQASTDAATRGRTRTSVIIAVFRGPRTTKWRSILREPF
ncbi:MAG: hypothetical protein JWP89_6966 [Schlesneria sp.]|nr:hypothetical protein [Schlesneria sp.]